MVFKQKVFLRLVFFMIINLLTINFSNSQSKTYVGVRGGANMSVNLIRHNFYRIVVNPRYTNGQNAGLVIKHYKNKNVGLQTGIEYIQKGWKQFFFDFYPEYSARVDYIEIPFLMNVQLGNGKTKFFVNMGCFSEWIIGSKLDNDPGEVEPFDFYTYDAQRDGKFGYGIRGGGGVTYDLPYGQIMVETFFSYSLSNVFDPPTQDSLVPNVSNNFVAGISLAYLISFGKLEVVSKKNK